MIFEIINEKEIRIHSRVKNGGGKTEWCWQILLDSQDLSIWHRNQFRVKHSGNTAHLLEKGD